MNDLERRFLHHPPTSPAVVQSHELTRRSYLSLARIAQQLPESRERELGLMRLEESSFWMHAAIARGQVSYPALAKANAAPEASADAPAAAPPVCDAGLRLEEFSAAELAALLSPVRFQRRLLLRSGTRADQLAALEQRLVDELRLRVVPDPVAAEEEPTPESAPAESVAETVSPTTG
jgi:hypothetical protein